MMSYSMADGCGVLTRGHTEPSVPGDAGNGEGGRQRACSTSAAAAQLADDDPFSLVRNPRGARRLWIDSSMTAKYRRIKSQYFGCYRFPIKIQGLTSGGAT
jgi:hypothetical protein